MGASLCLHPFFSELTRAGFDNGGENLTFLVIRPAHVDAGCMASRGLACALPELDNLRSADFSPLRKGAN